MKTEIKDKLEQIKLLFDSNLISELEYNTLKEEILFDKEPNSPHNKEKTNQISINKENNNDINSNSYEEHYKNNENTSLNINTQNEGISKYYYFAFFIIFSIIMMNIFSNDNSNQVNNINSSVDSTSIITNSNDISSSETCNICNNKFTHNGYTEDLNGNWIMCSDSYQSQICSPSCGRKHFQSLNQIAKEMGVDLESNSSSFKNAPINNYGEGHISGDGKFYENNKCGLCNGTGIEKNRSSLTDEYGRICPMCDGKGVRSY